VLIRQEHGVGLGLSTTGKQLLGSHTEGLGYRDSASALHAVRERDATVVLTYG
jgi:hypothetical protein